MVNFATALTLSSRKRFYTSYNFPVLRNRDVFTYLLLLGNLSSLFSASLLLALALLQEGLRDQDLVVGGNGTVYSFRLVRSPQHTW
jgi:hypothetical protein